MTSGMPRSVTAQARNSYSRWGYGSGLADFVATRNDSQGEPHDPLAKLQRRIRNRRSFSGCSAASVAAAIERMKNTSGAFV